jgi:ribosomal protein S20
MAKTSYRRLSDILIEGADAAVTRLKATNTKRLSKLRTYAYAVGETLYEHVEAGLLTNQELVAVLASAAAYCHQKENEDVIAQEKAAHAKSSGD